MSEKYNQESALNAYEWKNRLGATVYNLTIQALNLRGYIASFKERLHPEDIDGIEEVANELEGLAQALKKIEDNILDS